MALQCWFQVFYVVHINFSGSSSGYVRETVASGENAYVLDNQLPPNAQEAVTNQENPQNVSLI